MKKLSLTICRWRRPIMYQRVMERIYNNNYSFLNKSTSTLPQNMRSWLRSIPNWIRKIKNCRWISPMIPQLSCLKLRSWNTSSNKKNKNFRIFNSRWFLVWIRICSGSRSLLKWKGHIKKLLIKRIDKYPNSKTSFMSWREIKKYSSFPSPIKKDKLKEK